MTKDHSLKVFEGVVFNEGCCERFTARRYEVCTRPAAMSPRSSPW